MIASNIPAGAAAARSLDDVTTVKWPIGAVAHAAVVLIAVAIVWSNDETVIASAMGTLAHATEATERITRGQVLEIRQLGVADGPAFAAAVSLSDTVLYLRIVPVMGLVTELDDSERPLWLMNYGMQAPVRGIARGEVSLVEAILKAEQDAHAPAIAAGVAKPLRGGTVFAYYVETAHDRARQLLAMDAQTGAVVANPDAALEPWYRVSLRRRRS